jgi:hypothetical protein
MARNYGGRGGGRGRGRGRRGGGYKPTQTTKKSTSSHESGEKYKRSENLKDPVNFYSLGSTTTHLVEVALITQVILLSHLQKTLRNGSDIVEALETGIPFDFQSIKPAPVVKPEPKNKAAVKTGEDPEWDRNVLARYEQDKDINSREIDLWLKRKTNYVENQSKAFGTILSQCTDRLMEKIKNQADFETRVKNNPIELLKDIRKLSVSHTDDKYDMSLLHDAMRSFCNLYQNENEPLSRYSQRLIAARDVLVTYLGGKIDLTGTPSAKKKLSSSPSSPPSVDEEWDRFCAYLYMAHAQKQRYGSLLQDMENDAVRNKSNDDFPKTIPDAEHLLSEYKSPYLTEKTPSKQHGKGKHGDENVDAKGSRRTCRTYVCTGRRPMLLLWQEGTPVQ